MAFHQYNKQTYNVGQYNADVLNWYQALSETITLSEVVAKAFTTSKSETVTPSETFGKTVTKATFTETVTASEAAFVKALLKGLAETINATEAITGKAVTKAISETVTPTETFAKMPIFLFLDVLLGTDEIVSRISDKGLSDRVRLSAWLSADDDRDQGAWADNTRDSTDPWSH